MAWKGGGIVAPWGMGESEKEVWGLVRGRRRGRGAPGVSVN